VRGLLIALGVSVSLVWARSQAPAPPAAPSVEFVRLFNQYRTGDADAAVTEFASWDRARVEDESAFDEPGGDLREKATLALFHTEAGIRNGAYSQGVSGPTSSSGSDYLEPHARAAKAVVLQLAKATIPADERLTMFCRDWLLVHRAIVMRWRGGWNPTQAAPFLENDPDVLFQEGALFEKTMGPEIDSGGNVGYEPGLDPFAPGGNRLESFAHGNMSPGFAREAEDRLKQALKTRSDLIEARLHLGRLYYMTDRFADAERELKTTYTAAYRSHDVFVGYLAALFLGQLQQDRHRPDEARASYQAAIDINAGGQAAHLALGQLLLSIGRTDEGWHVMRTAVAPPGGEAVDPWAVYPDAEFERVPALLREMREVVRP
jgi:tetratricopeptide (TPR) repeat protein